MMTLVASMMSWPKKMKAIKKQSTESNRMKFHIYLLLLLFSYIIKTVLTIFNINF